MNCQNCEDYDVLFRSVARSKAWVDSCLTFIQSEVARKYPKRSNLSRSALRRYETIFSSYFLELSTLNHDPVDVIANLYSELSRETKLSQGVIAEILEVKSQRDISKKAYPSVDQVERVGLFDNAGYLSLYNPERVSLKTALRYELIRKAWNLDWSLCPGTPFLAVPTELGTGQYYSLYPDPETRGVLKKPGSKLYSTLLSESKGYNEFLIKTVHQLLRENRAAEFLLISEKPIVGTLPKEFWSEKIKHKENGYLYIAGNGEKMVVARKIQEKFPPIPAVPVDFSSMYSNLKEIADNPPISWAKAYRNHDGNEVTTPTLKLGFVTRSFEKDYFTADSISDVFSYKERIKCHVTNRRTGEPMMTQAQYWVENRIFTRRLLEENKITREQLPDFIYDRTKTCGIFSASLAVYVYKKFGGKGSRVLDGFAGWGDRLIAASVVDCSVYDGFDTNPYIPYSDMIQRVGKDYKVSIQPYETAELRENYYDISLLSPPFFMYELYTGETTSTTVHDKLEDWIENFWKPCLKITLKAIRRGGYIALYIPSGNDETGIGMRDAVEEVFGYFTIKMGSLGFGHVSGDNQIKIRQTYIYKKN